MRVTGPDQGGGTNSPGFAPTTAVVNIDNPAGWEAGIYTLEFIDNGGGGLDILNAGPSPGNARSPTDCSPLQSIPATFPLVGRAVVFDAPTTTTSFTTYPSPSTVGTPVTFDASSSTCAADPCTYAWSDATTKLGSGTQLTYTFRYVGTKHVVLTLIDAHGLKSTVHHDLQVNSITTTARFTTNPSPATVRTPVTFDASSSTCAAAPCTCTWSDGATKLGSGTQLTFTFHYAGTKHVRLTVTDARSRKSSVQHDLQVS